MQKKIPACLNFFLIKKKATGTFSFLLYKQVPTFLFFPSRRLKMVCNGFKYSHPHFSKFTVQQYHSVCTYLYSFNVGSLFGIFNIDGICGSAVSFSVCAG